MRKSSTYNDPLISGGRQVVILFLLIMNRITDRILPWGTPISSCFGSESVLFIRVWNVQSSKKCFIKMGSLPCRPRSLRSLSMPYGQVVSQAFSRSKRTATRCSFLMNASLIRVSIWTIWSMVLLWALKEGYWIQGTMLVLEWSFFQGFCRCILLKLWVYNWLGLWGLFVFWG